MSHGPKHLEALKGKTKTVKKIGEPETEIKVVVGHVRLTLAHQSSFDIVDRPLVTDAQRAAIVADAEAHDPDDWKIKALRKRPLKLLDVTSVAWNVLASIPNLAGGAP